MSISRIVGAVALSLVTIAGTSIAQTSGTQTAPVASPSQPSINDPALDARNLTPPANVPKQLTLSEAIQAAITNNYTIRTTANQVRRSEIESRRSTDALLPAASASASYGYRYSLIPVSDRTFIIPGDTLTGVPQREIITPAGSQSLSYNVGASFNIYNGGSDAARIRSANASLDAQRNTLTWTRQQIAYNVTSAYINALRTRELVESSKKTLAESRAQLARVRGLYQAGSIPIGQVYQQEAVVGQNELQSIQAQNDFENATADVLYLLNVPPDQYGSYSVSVTGIDTTTSSARRSAVDTNITVSRLNDIINARPDIVARRQQIAAQEASIDVTRGALLPSLDATAGIGGSGSNPDLTKIHTTNSLSAGLSLQVPIFDRNQNRLAIEEQEIDLENQRIGVEQDIQTIRSDAAKSVNNIRAADQALDASDRALRSAEESLRLAEERLRVGAGTQIDVIVAQAQVETARTNRVNAKFNYVLAERQLQYTLGQWSY